MVQAGRFRLERAHAPQGVSSAGKREVDAVNDQDVEIAATIK
jgi:hypothetical protein